MNDSHCKIPNRGDYSVGIVGAGMAGLYAALLLKMQGVKYHIYELDDRVGGRILTHRFTSEKNQYFEAGAMRVPDTKIHQPVKDLIKYLNSLQPHHFPPAIQTIPYTISHPGNFIHVNNKSAFRVQDTIDFTANALGFNLPDPYGQQTADQLLQGVLKKYLEALKQDFNLAIQDIIRKWDRISFRQYLETEVKWPDSVINFVELLSSQTNQFSLSFPELVVQNLDFGTSTWWTIAGGMDRLPQTLANAVGMENITFNSRVYRIEQETIMRATGEFTPNHSFNSSSSGGINAADASFVSQKITSYIDQRVILHASGHRAHDVVGVHNRIILAIPPVAIRAMLHRPRWSPEKEHVISATHFEPLYKLGLRFKTRFWERGANPSYGGQSTTDLPIRWIVYPSYGWGESGPGVILLYSWMSDAAMWSSIPRDERIKLALGFLARVYENCLNIDIYDQFMAAEDYIWSSRTPTGDCMLLPGQSSDSFEVAKDPEGPIYFAGEHLSRHHTWITGALDSARCTIQMLLGDLGIPCMDGWPISGDSSGDNKYNSDEDRKKFIQSKVGMREY